MASRTTQRETIQPRRVVEFLERSKLINLDMPVGDLVRGVSDLDEVAGYVIAWEKYVLVIGVQAEMAVLPEINR